MTGILTVCGNNSLQTIHSFSLVEAVANFWGESDTHIMCGDMAYVL
jgi:hypothetical protein